MRASAGRCCQHTMEGESIQKLAREGEGNFQFELHLGRLEAELVRQKTGVHKDQSDKAAAAAASENPPNSRIQQPWTTFTGCCQPNLQRDLWTWTAETSNTTRAVATMSTCAPPFPTVWALQEKAQCLSRVNHCHLQHHVLVVPSTHCPIDASLAQFRTSQLDRTTPPRFPKPMHVFHQDCLSTLFGLRRSRKTA